MENLQSAGTKVVQPVSMHFLGEVTDPATTIVHLNDIIQQFTPPALQKYNSTDAADDQNVYDLLRIAMNAAEKTSRDLFVQLFPGNAISGSDRGVITYYKWDIIMQSMRDQLGQDFSNWGLPVDDDVFMEMTNTIRVDTAAKLGMASNSKGIHSLNNQLSLNWTLTYGLFMISFDNMGLVYGFSAGMSGY